MRNESWNGALLILLIMEPRVASSFATRRRARCSVCHLGDIVRRGGEDTDTTGASFVGFFEAVIRQDLERAARKMTPAMPRNRGPGESISRTCVGCMYLILNNSF